MRAVTLDNVSFRYRGMEEDVLKHCSLNLDYGEFLLLSGPSGEGKSTLLNLVNGIIPNAVAGTLSGRVEVAGTPALGQTMADLCRRVGSVLQNADSQIVHTVVEDEVAFGCENLRADPEDIRRRVVRSCSAMKLDPAWRTKTLSGGQKQRLITASTLAMGQKILVFDEPLANLDQEGARLLLETLDRLARKEGYAVLFVEHRLDMAIPYAHRVAWLEKGRLEILARPGEALERSRKCISDLGALPASRQACLTADRLAWGAGERAILKDVSFTLHRGERLLILGENGCGKTTLLRLLAGLQKPQGGAVTAQLSHPAKPGTPKWFQRVGFVYQNPGYQMFLSTVGDEVAYHAASPRAVQDRLADFSLEELVERHPHALSEGQKRRVSIAAVAAGEPEILLLDEPTVGQDYHNLELLVASLNALHRKTGSAMITVTHDYRCAAALADRVLWLQDGRVFREGGKELIESYFTGREAACKEDAYVQ